MRWNGLPTVIFGSGGISKEVYKLLNDINKANNQNVFEFLGFVEKDKSLLNEKICSFPVIATDDTFLDFSKNFPLLSVIIPNGFPEIKRKICEKINKIGNLVFPNLIHPEVFFDQTTIKIGMGNIITEGVRFTRDIVIGDFNLFNLNTTIGHDSKISNYGVFNPLCAISGGVKIGNEVLLGTGAKILQNIVIESHSIVGAGAVVTKNVSSNSTVVGVPAKEIKR